MQTLSAKQLIAQKPAATRRAAARAAPVAVKPVASSQEVSRRAALSGVVGVAGVSLLAAKPALAAYGEAANVFGAATNTTGFVPYAGDGYAILIPAKYNKSAEREFPGIDVRYEDNFDAVNTLMVLVNQGKSKMEDYGSPEAYLPNLSTLLGQQAWQGETASEGGFKEGKVSVANVLSVGSKSVDGRTYYQYEILTRTADGDEGGRHHLFSITAANGKLYTAKAQVGDKRWFKARGARWPIP